MYPCRRPGVLFFLSLARSACFLLFATLGTNIFCICFFSLPTDWRQIHTPEVKRESSATKIPSASAHSSRDQNLLPILPGIPPAIPIDPNHCTIAIGVDPHTAMASACRRSFPSRRRSVRKASLLSAFVPPLPFLYGSSSEPSSASLAGGRLRWIIYQGR